MPLSWNTKLLVWWNKYVSFFLIWNSIDTIYLYLRFPNVRWYCLFLSFAKEKCNPDIISLIDPTLCPELLPLRLSTKSSNGWTPWMAQLASLGMAVGVVRMPTASVRMRKFTKRTLKVFPFGVVFSFWGGWENSWNALLDISCHLVPVINSVVSSICLLCSLS